MPPHQREPSADDLKLLETGEIELKGLIPWSSNYTFLVSVKDDSHEKSGIYKPEQGERPLHDFAAGLHNRERAAFVVSEALGWHLVPPTVIRADAPGGIGSVQLAITDADQQENYFTIYEDSAFHEQLKQIALFDLLINNADRKGGHILRDSTNQLWAIDNGLAFHVEEKLRTVIWEFAGEEIPPSWREQVAAFGKDLPEELHELLNQEELTALSERAAALGEQTQFPSPASDWSYPWPLI